MRLIIKASKKIGEPESPDAVRRQVLLALSTYAPRIARLTVSQRPHESADRAEFVCQLAVELRSGEKAVFTQFSTSPLEAVYRSAARAASWVRRQLLSQHEKQVTGTTFPPGAHRFSC